MIYTMMPFAPDMNLGRAYNEAMRLLGPNDWACFLDHDAIWTTREWYKQLQEVVERVPEAGLVTAVQSRGWQEWQVGPKAGRDINDMAYHRKVGRDLLRNRTLLDVTQNSGCAGVVMLISKKTWQEIGGAPDGMYCVDHAVHFKVAAIHKRVYVLESLYVFHWRRWGGDRPPSDAPTAPNCMCSFIRRREQPPTRRIAL